MKVTVSLGVVAVLKNAGGKVRQGGSAWIMAPRITGRSGDFLVMKIIGGL